MYRWYIRRFKSLPRLQHIVVFLTTFTIPVSFELVQSWQDTGFCLSCLNWGELVLYVVFYQIAMLLIASATMRDRARVEERLDRVYCELNNHIAKISEEHQRQMTGIEDRVGDLREWVRNIDSAMRDQLGADLPARAVSARGASFHFDVPEASITKTDRSPSGWRPRLLRWINRQARNIRRWAHKIIVDLEEG